VLRMRRRILLGGLGTGALALLRSGSSPGRERTSVRHRGTTSITVALGQRQVTTWAKTDTNASIDQDAQGATWMILGDASAWAIYRGTSIDHMQLEHRYQPDFPRPHADDLYWSSGLWIDRRSDTWYCAVHCEYNYGRYTGKPPTGPVPWSPDHRRRMVLVTSTDHGRHWTLIGDILTGAHPDDPRSAPGDYYDKGDGDGQLYIDEHFFYMFYRTGWYQKSHDKFFETVRVARCPLSGRMQPGSWRKWYRGSWNEPGLHGFDSDVFNSNSGDTAAVFFSRHLGCYVALIGAGDPDVPEGYIATCDSLDRQDWTDPIRFCDAATHEDYNWVLDPQTLSRHVIEGRSFRYYTSKNTPPVWHEATFGVAPAGALVKPPLYPPDSVDDRNPGWDRSMR